MKRTIMGCAVGVLLLAGFGHAGEPPGLTVKDGLFHKDGRPFRGVGINYFSCFIRITGMAPMGAQLDNRDYREGFRVLRSYDIPFVRFCAGGFYPVDWKLYQTDKEKYFALLDGLVAEAEKQGLGLIPSLFWAYSTVPDLVGETLDQMGNPDSKTIAFIRRYTTEVVSRYKDSPAIWAWEFGNEWLHEADLPHMRHGRGWIAPEFGTPASRSKKDTMLRPDIYVAYRTFFQTVRSIDPTRPVFTGDVMPRPAAWHNRNMATWDIDSPEQWKRMFLADNPFDTLAAHFYYYDKDELPREAGVLAYGPEEQMKFLTDISREVKKPLFIGEFGQKPDPNQPVATQFQQVETMIGLIEKYHVQLAALWNYDLEADGQYHCNVTCTNERAGMLGLLKKANRLGAISAAPTHPKSCTTTVPTRTNTTTLQRIRNTDRCSRVSSRFVPTESKPFVAGCSGSDARSEDAPTLNANRLRCVSPLFADFRRIVERDRLTDDGLTPSATARVRMLSFAKLPFVFCFDGKVVQHVALCVPLHLALFRRFRSLTDCDWNNGGWLDDSKHLNHDIPMMKPCRAPFVFFQ